MRSVYTLFAVVLCAALFFSSSNNPPNGRTGAPGDGLCSDCHGGGSYQGNVQLTGLPTTVDANTTYTLTLTTTATSGSPVRSGFQVVALDENNQNIGDLIVVNAGETGTNTAGSGREYMEHRGAKNFSGNTVSWNFEWEAPNGPNGEQITFYFASLLANGSGSGNDNTVNSQFNTTLSGAAPLGIQLTSSMDVSCPGGNDGSATVQASGGTPPISISWSNGANGPTANNLTAGSYTATATDAFGESIEIEVTILEPDPLSLDLVAETTLTCIEPATLTVSAGGGTPGFTYQWSTGTPGDTEVLNSPDEVTVTATDLNGCSIDLAITPQVDQESPLVAVQGGQLTCLQPEVLLESTVTANCNDLLYTWIDPSGAEIGSANSVSVNEAGVYTLEVINLCNGCLTITEVEVEENLSIPELNVPVIQDSLNCTQQTIEIAAGPAGPDLTFAWSTANGVIAYGQDSTIVGVTSAGTYTVLVTDTNNGCINTTDIEIGAYTDPVASLDSIRALDCFGDMDGYAAISAMEGLPPYSFAWPDGNQTSEREDLSAGTYLVTITDQNSCTAEQEVEIAQPDMITITVDSITPTLSGQASGAIFVSLEGGTGSINATWTGPNNYSSTEEDPTGLEAGTYTLVVTDENGCTEMMTEITVPLATSMLPAWVGKVRVYPVPTQTDLQITLPDNADYTLTLRDAYGRIVAQRPGQRVKAAFDLSGQPSGIYLLEVRSEQDGSVSFFQVLK